MNLQTPVHTIASNAGVEGAVVVGKLLEQDELDLGYDAAKGSLVLSFPNLKFIFFLMLLQVVITWMIRRTGEYVDMVKAGIIDPLKVIRTALVDAAR